MAHQGAVAFSLLWLPMKLLLPGRLPLALQSPFPRGLFPVPGDYTTHARLFLSRRQRCYATHLGPLRRPSLCFKHHSLVFQSCCLLQRAQSCLTLCDPTDYSPPGSSVNGIFQARMLGWVAISFSMGSPQARDQTHVSCVSYTGRWILFHQTTWEAHEQD